MPMLDNIIFYMSWYDGILTLLVLELENAGRIPNSKAALGLDIHFRKNKQTVIDSLPEPVKYFIEGVLYRVSILGRVSFSLYLMYWHNVFVRVCGTNGCYMYDNWRFLPNCCCSEFPNILFVLTTSARSISAPYDICLHRGIDVWQQNYMYPCIHASLMKWDS